jgi:hypothetical protein
MVEGELFPALRDLGIRFYAYNPVCKPHLRLVSAFTVFPVVAGWWIAHWQVQEGRHGERARGEVLDCGWKVGQVVSAAGAGEEGGEEGGEGRKEWRII